MKLDLEGVAASVGSACTTGSAEPSHVLTAMGYPDEEARGALRISLGRTTTDVEIDEALERRAAGRSRGASRRGRAVRRAGAGAEVAWREAAPSAGR